MHGGHNQPNYSYNIKGKPIAVVHEFKDLGVLRSSKGFYVGQCDAVAAAASRVSGAIRRLFQSKAPELLWPAFRSYVLPKLMYNSQAWNPSLIKEINKLERVQKRFTKSIRGLHDMPYEDRLKKLRTLSIQKQRRYADMTFTYKAIHGVLNCPAEDLGLKLLQVPTRGGGTKLVQRRAN